jgi:hypothetical protein
MFAGNRVVYCKRPFAAGEKVVDYIGRYSCRVAIANSRITNISERDVSFTCKNRRKEGETSTVTLTGVEFLRRFSMHFLPAHFVKIRHFGYLAPSNRKKLRDLQLEFKLQPIPVKREKLTWNSFCLIQTGHESKWCPFCNSDYMITMEYFPNKTCSLTSRPPPLAIHE